MTEEHAVCVKGIAKKLFLIQRAGGRARKPYGERKSLAARQGVDMVVDELVPLLCSQTTAQYFAARLLADGAFAKDVELVALVCRLCKKDAIFKDALRGEEEVQRALRDPTALKLFFSADDMLALRFHLKHCSMEGVKRLRQALMGVKVGQVKVEQIKHIYKRRDVLFEQCGVAITALDPADVSGNGQCRVADVGAFLRKIFEHPTLKKTFTREIVDHSTVPPVPVMFVLASVRETERPSEEWALRKLALGNVNRRRTLLLDANVVRRSSDYLSPAHQQPPSREFRRPRVVHAPACIRPPPSTARPVRGWRARWRRGRGARARRKPGHQPPSPDAPFET
jgi:hypothetical protein